MKHNCVKFLLLSLDPLAGRPGMSINKDTLNITPVYLKIVKTIFCFAIVFCICGFSSSAFSAGIDHLDGGGEWEPCPHPIQCNEVQNGKTFSDKALSSVNKQDNGYHNMLQSLHGATLPTINIYQELPEDTTTDPPTPAKYKAVTPPEYIGVIR